MKIGVLALQGAVSEHLDMIRNCGVECLPVKRPGEIPGLDALVIPGGESTTIGRLLQGHGLAREVRELAREGRPLYGTCAGMVLLAAEIEGEVPHLSLLDIKVRRNAFGRQRESFEGSVHIPLLGEVPFPGVFIRAPYVTRAGPGVEVLGHCRGKIVAVKQGNILATAFHPELTGDQRFHRLLIDLAGRAKEKKNLQ